MLWNEDHENIINRDILEEYINQQEDIYRGCNYDSEEESEMDFITMGKLEFDIRLNKFDL